MKRFESPFVERTEQIDVVNGISSNYACQNWCDSNYHSSYLSPANSEIEAGESVQMKVFQKDYDQSLASPWARSFTLALLP